MRALRDHGPSLAFGVLLLLALVGQMLTGQAELNEHAVDSRLPTFTLREYVTSSRLTVDVAENWQSEYLQFLLFIMLTVWLVQRGSPESKKAEEAGRAAYNAEQLVDLQRPLGWGEYLSSPDFWNRSLQNWRSEFLAVGTMVVFSIFLRERGSPESKPVGEPHDATGIER